MPSRHVLLDMMRDAAVVVTADALVVAANRTARLRLGLDVGDALDVAVPIPELRAVLASASEVGTEVPVLTAGALRSPRDTTPLIGEITAMRIGRSPDEWAVRLALGLQLSSPSTEEVSQLHVANRELFTQQRLRHRLGLQQRRLEAFLDAMPLGALECDPAGRIVEANLTALALFETSRDGLEGTRLAWWLEVDRSMQQAVTGTFRAVDATERRSERGGGGLLSWPSPVYCTARRADGTQFPARLDWSALRGDDGQPRGTACLISDITELRAAQRQLQWLADTDALTGALNRRRFLEVAGEELERIARYGRPGSVVLFDLDHFKVVNDTWGHAAGDDALRAFAEVVEVESRALDAFARWGGEEFVALLPETSIEDAIVFADRVRKRLEVEPLQCRAGSVPLTVSAGVTDLRADEGIEPAVKRADAALYEAKAAGRNRTVALLGDDAAVAPGASDTVAE